MSTRTRSRSAARWTDPGVLGSAHGLFNVVGGAWPLLSIGTFERVFGPKTDRWLEYTVAGLMVGNGIAQIAAARSGEHASARRVGCGTAATLLAIDLVFVPAGRLRWTYLLDAGFELGWLVLWGRQRAGLPGR